MQQNVRIKISCQNWAFNLYFAFWKLDLCHVLLLFLAYQTFQGSRKIELKTQLPLVSKKKQKKTTDFERWILKIWRICFAQIQPL